ncbi:MAG: hypothetical protein ACREPK_05205 [Rhodanobacteraceae bacterium]
MADAGKTTLVLASLTGKDAHTVALPGRCVETGLRWANAGYGSGVWPWQGYELAVMTHCANGAGPMHSVIWLLDTDKRHANTSPRKIADLAGYAHCMQWTAQDKGVAFLYVPGALRAPDAPTSGNCESQGLNALSPHGDTVQRVGMITVVDHRKLEMITPAGMNVYEFAWVSFGQQALLYVASPTGGTRWSARLYRKWGNATPGQWVVVDPATAPALRGRHIAMPSWDIFHPMVYFLGIKNDKNATSGNWYRVSSGGKALVNLTPGSGPKPSWVDPSGGLGTRRVDGKVELLRLPRALSSPYGPAGTTRILFSVPGTISDGRAPLAMSIALDGMAFVQSSPDSAPEVHAKRGGNLEVPPTVTFINVGVKAEPDAQ